MLFLALKSFACSCAPPPPPCEAIGQSELVFLGTITSVDKQSAQFLTARMTIDKAFKGALNSTVELFDTGMCDGPDLQVGKQYLMYSSGDPNTRISSRGCTRSRAVEFAKEDVEFLNLYSAAKTRTHAEGIVRFTPDHPTNEELAPMKGVEVRLSGNGMQLSATTTAEGAFSFPDVEPGTYSIEALCPGFYLASEPHGINLVAHGCSETNLVMGTDRRIQGIVQDHAGKSLQGVRVEIVPLKQDPDYQPSLIDITDESGRYTIKGVPPGKFWLGINIDSPPTSEYPHPRLYYPYTADRHTAAWITVPQDASVQEFHLRAAPKLEVVTIHGRVEMVNGKPPKPEDFPSVRVESAEGNQLDSQPVVDLEGRFEFQVCKGAEYRLWAFAGRPGASLYSDRLKFKPETDSPTLTLTLAKTREQFRRRTRP